MTTEEKLNAIVAKCREVLSSRDNGFVMPTGYVGKNAIKGEHYRSGYASGFAARAGQAEAAARSTIAAIESLQLIRRGSAPELWHDEKAENGLLAILAAWPDELLQTTEKP